MTPKAGKRTSGTAPADAKRLAEAEARYQAGDLGAARRILERLAKRYPDDAALLEALGAVALRQQRYQAAATCFRRALAAQPDAAGLHSNLSLALVGAGESVGALEAAQRAAALAPGVAQFQVNLGNRLRALGRGREAVAAYRQAIAANPNFIAAHLSLGSSLAGLGESAAALAQYREALAIAPDNARAFYHLALASKAGQPAVEAPTREHFSRLAQSGALPPADLVLARSGLGFIADLEGDSDAAFAHFTAANEGAHALQRAAGRAHDRAAHSRWVDRIIAAFPHPATSKPSGSDSRRPLFILGMPRSGTTLVEQILANHSMVAAGGELPDLARIADSIAAYPKGVVGLSSGKLTALAARYLDALARFDDRAQRVTDKMPHNFLHIGLIGLLFPQAVIVHCRRDPLDTCLSCYFQNFTQGNAFATDLADIAGFYRDYRRLMAHWRRLDSGRLIEVDYERLVAEPEAQVRHLLAALDLPWEARCLDTGRAGNLVRSASQWQVRAPIHGQAAGRAQRYRRHLGPLIEALGELAETER